MKKVVVLFPYPNSETLGRKVYAQNDDYPNVYADNTEEGCLIIKRGMNKGIMEVVAVFKEWIYWERIE